MPPRGRPTLVVLSLVAWACLLLHEPISAQQAIGGAGTCAAALLAAAVTCSVPRGGRAGDSAAAAAAVPEEAADGAARGVVVPTRAAALAAARGEPVPGEAREKVASARMRRGDSSGALLTGRLRLILILSFRDVFLRTHGVLAFGRVRSSVSPRLRTDHTRGSKI